MKYIVILIGSIFLSGCWFLSFEPPISGITLIYNYCSHPIELRYSHVPDEMYATNKRPIIIDVNSSTHATAYGDNYPFENFDVNNIKEYFIENGMKKHFTVDKYSNKRLNLIACSENAKPTGDGNWIKAN